MSKMKPFDTVLSIQIPQQDIEIFHDEYINDQERWRDDLKYWRGLKKLSPEKCLMSEFGYVLDEDGNLCFEEVYMGDFKMESGVMMVSDPCYERGTWCQGEIGNIKNGTWRVIVKYYSYPFEHEGEEMVDKRVAELIALHEDFSDYLNDGGSDFINEYADIDVGVDSGQAGLFDSKYFRKDKCAEGFVAPKSRYDDGDRMDWLKKESPFYAACCRSTLGIHSAGVLAYGCVSSSGFGDGSYNAEQLSRSQGGEVEGVRIIFL